MGPLMLGPSLALLMNAASTWYMTGLIWFVQVVHYPQFAQVGAASWSDYHRRHSRWTTVAVGPPMLIELATSVALVFWPPTLESRWECGVGLALVVAIWLSTAMLQVPCHNRLAGSFDGTSLSRLCRTNWLRTAGWTARSCLCLHLLASQMPR